MKFSKNTLAALSLTTLAACGLQDNPQQQSTYEADIANIQAEFSNSKIDAALKEGTCTVVATDSCQELRCSNLGNHNIEALYVKCDGTDTISVAVDRNRPMITATVKDKKVEVKQNNDASNEKNVPTPWSKPKLQNKEYETYVDVTIIGYNQNDYNFVYCEEDKLSQKDREENRDLLDCGNGKKLEVGTSLKIGIDGLINNFSYAFTLDVDSEEESEKSDVDEEITEPKPTAKKPVEPTKPKPKVKHKPLPNLRDSQGKPLK